MLDTREIVAEYRLSHWAQVMEDRMSRGLSVKAYCKQEGFPVNKYYYWQKKLREAACTALIEVSQTNGEPSQIWASICVRHEIAAKEITVEVGGCRIAVTQATDTLLLAKVCQALKVV